MPSLIARATSASLVMTVVATNLGAQTTLKDAFKDAFLIGTAMSARQFSALDSKAAALVRSQYNTISPENSLKGEVVHPQPGRFDFTEGDQYVAFGEKNKMFTVGHTLV